MVAPYGFNLRRAEERSERFTEYSEHRTADAERAQKAVSAIADNIPFGQPILLIHVGRDAPRRQDVGYRNLLDRPGAISNAKHKERVSRAPTFAGGASSRNV